MAADLRRVFGNRFLAHVASGQAHSAVFVTSISAGDLDALASLSHVWHHDHLASPLVLTLEEFNRSLDAFPVEYQAIIDRHVVIAGIDPFAGLEAHADDLRRACEIQAKSHLIHLRQGWIDAGGDTHALARVVEQSSAPLRALLMNVARLHGLGTLDDAPLAAAELAGLPEPIVRDVLALEQAPEKSVALAARLPDYLAASLQLWAFVDRWRTR